MLPQLRGLLDDLTKLQKAHYLEICNTEGLYEDDIDKQIAAQVEQDNEFNDKVKVCIARLSLIIKGIGYPKSSNFQIMLHYA